MSFTALIDTREQNPLVLQEKPGKVIPAQEATLYTGDYSIKGLEHLVAIERKSLDDLMGCIGKHRERFEREIMRLRGYEVKALVVESDWAKIEMGAYRSRVSASAAIGSLMSWVGLGIPVLMAGCHERAGLFVGRILTITAKRRLAELKAISA